MQDHLTKSLIMIDTTLGILDDSDQEDRREAHPSERDRMAEERAPFPFRGDGDGDGPPLAWTIIWGGTYSNLYGYVGTWCQVHVHGGPQLL